MSAGKGSAKGNSDLRAESVVTANDTLTLVSGNDTTIQGAQAVGNKSPLKNPQTTSIARLHLRYRCAGIAS
ncbi:hemagglutinin repeat-containing protein, partial [Xanthomonas campestris pv. heliotropii]|nr:hemagglutinin repeat-containing protein [Xanthomonas campestris pv. heliotropii]